MRTRQSGAAPVAASPVPWPGFGLRGPRHGLRPSSRSRVASLSLPLADDGVVAGTDDAGGPVVLGLFRPVQLDVVVVGSAWTAQVLALRAVGAGARVAVESARPRLWAPLAAATSADGPGVVVHGVGGVLPHREPAPSAPVLVVRDCGAKPPRNGLAPAPWQAVLTLLPFLGPLAAEPLAQAELVGVQRVSPQEAEELAGVLRLPREQAAALPTLDDGTLLWCTARQRRFARLVPTPSETELLGEARRID